MKLYHLCFAFLFLLSCQSDKKEIAEKPLITKPSAPSTPPKVEKTLSSWDKFWINFQKAVVESDAKFVAANTILPLAGSEPMNNGKAIGKADFGKYFDTLFDARAKEIFAASSGNMSDFAVKNKLIAEQLSVPANVKIRAISVSYVFNKGTKKQTESSTTFHFAETAPNVFQLVSIILAGYTLNGIKS